MTPEEFDNLKLTDKDFEITMNGVLIKYNSNVIKLILKRQELFLTLKKLRKEFLQLKITDADFIHKTLELIEVKNE